MDAKEILEVKILKRAKEHPAVGKAINAPVVFDLSGDGGGTWTLDFTTPEVSVYPGVVENPKVTFCMAAADFVAMVEGELNAQKAFLTGKLKVKGDMGSALKLGQLLS
ncbi:MAG: SCP2 sterol-binding domain-containing protein [Deltaproteobacteria bacterium]|nr:SCP2 sterol-binding domain-containing protein [Deltaproteobacteria bacterium]